MHRVYESPNEQNAEICYFDDDIDYLASRSLIVDRGLLEIAPSEDSISFQITHMATQYSNQYDVQFDIQFSQTKDLEYLTWSSEKFSSYTEITISAAEGYVSHENSITSL